jgi:hypothetical protein
MAEQAANSRVATVASGMFISRITSDDDKRSSKYDLRKVTDIEGFIPDTWVLDGKYEGVSLQGSILIVGSRVSYTIGVYVSNKGYAEKNGIEATEILITTTILSFYNKIKEYQTLVNSDPDFFRKIGTSMEIAAGDYDKNSGLIPFPDLKVRNRRG